MKTFNKKLKAIFLLIGIVLFTIPTFATTADAGADKTLNITPSRKAVYLKGSGTGEEPLTYKWYEDGRFIGRGAGRWYVITQSGEHNITLVVTDANGTTATDTMTVTVNKATANAGEDQESNSTLVHLNGSGTGKAPLSYKWYEKGHFIAEGQSCDYNISQNGQHEITLVVTDANGAKAKDKMVVTVNGGEDIPSLTADAGLDKTLNITPSNRAVHLVGTGTGKAPLSYKWYEGSKYIGPHANRWYVLTQNGQHEITLVVTDANGNEANDTMMVTVTNGEDPLDTTKPVITLLGDENVTLTVGDTYIDAGATAIDDVDGNITSNIQVTGLPIDTSSAGNYTVTYIVSDLAGNVADLLTRTVIIKKENNTINMPPIANAGLDINVTEGANVTLDGMLSSDSDGHIVGYVWKEGTTILSTNPSFSKNDFSVGTHTIVLTVTDDDNATSQDEILVTVNKEENKNISIIFINDGATSFATNHSEVLLEGFASSNIGIKSITCTNKTTGQELLANGMQEWSVTMPLTEGDNKITCIALANNNKTTNHADVTVVYYSNSAFTSFLDFSEDTFFVDETKNITALIGIDYNQSANMLVKLYEVDANDNLIPDTTFTMLDNGVLPDEIDKDGVFTVNFTLNEQSVSSRCYRVGIVEDNQNEYFSEKKCVNIVNHITQEEMQDFISIGEDISDIYTANSDPKVAAQKAYDILINDPRVGAVGITEDGEGLWYISSSGIAGGYHPIKSGKKGTLNRVGKPTDTKVYPRVSTLNYYIKNNNGNKKSTKLFKKAFKSTTLNIQKSSSNQNELSSKKALIISPFIKNPNDINNSFGNDDDYYSVWQDIKNKQSCQLYVDSEKINNGSVSVTLDDFKNLSEYGYIHISTHGDNYYRGLFSLWQPEWGTNNWLKGALSQVVLYTGHKLSKNGAGNYNYGIYEKDIKAHRIVLSGAFLAITPSFIKRYVKKLPNSIVTLSACRSAYNSSMANAFLAKGAKTVLGYTDYVYTGYSQDTTKTFVKELFANKNTLEAFNSSISAHGVDDSSYGANSDHAKFRMFGSKTLKLASSCLKNTSFEDGGLTPWKKVGDGRIITQLGASIPTDGKYMGIISTGLGYTTSAGSIEQTSCLKSSDTTLSFDWNFFSEEFKEYCGSIYQDTFKVTMCEFNSTDNTNSNCTVLFEKKVDDLCTQVLKVSNKFDQGDVYATGWQTTNVDISSYAGKSISLKFYSTDVGDSIYDSAILLDKIEIK